MSAFGRHRLLLLDNAANRRIGIGLITLTTLCFATLDACAKWLVQELPVLQVVWLRFLFHVLLLSALLAPRYGWNWCACATGSCRPCARRCWGR